MRQSVLFIQIVLIVSLVWGLAHCSKAAVAVALPKAAVAVALLL